MWVVDYFKKSLIEKYATFSGRARRKEYGSWIVATFLIGLVLGALEQIGVIGISAVFVLATLVPQLALTVRRFHDLGYSGWFAVGQIGLTLAAFAALLIGVFMGLSGGGGGGGTGVMVMIGVGLLFLSFLIAMALIFLKGEEGDNAYGADPRLDGVD